MLAGGRTHTLCGPCRSKSGRRSSSTRPPPSSDLLVRPRRATNSAQPWPASETTRSAAAPQTRALPRGGELPPRPDQVPPPTDSGSNPSQERPLIQAASRGAVRLAGSAPPSLLLLGRCLLRAAEQTDAGSPDRT